MPELMYDPVATLKLRQMQRDRQWFIDNYKKLRDLYNELNVAIKNEKVIDSDTDYLVLLKRITETYPQNHRSVIIEEITDKRPICIL